MSEMSAEGAAPAVADSAPVADTTAPANAPAAEVSGTPAPEVKTNPAWQPILDVLPSSLHGIVSPTLKDWDRGVQERFRELHGQYEPLKAYEQFATNNVPPEDIIAALGLIQQIEANPREVWESMGSYYNLTPAQQAAVEAATGEEGYDPTSFTDPTQDKVAQLEASLETLSQIIFNEREQNTQAAQERAMEDALGEMGKKYGEYNREFVLTQMAAGVPMEDAFKSYAAIVEDIKTNANKPSAPVVVGGGTGGVPAPKSTKGMSGPERRAMVAQMLEQAKNS